MQDSLPSIISFAVEASGAEYSRRESNTVFRILKVIGGIYCRAFHRTRVVQPCRLPKEGPAILVSNHTSSIDPILLQTFSPRLVRWMMAKEYFDYRSMRWLYKAMGVILVERSGRDLASTRTAMRVLASGYVLGMFPEGKLETTRDLIPFHSGIGLLAVKTRAPVYPAFVDGTQRNREMVEAVVTPCIATVAFAPPVDLADLTDCKAGALEATRRIQAAVEALRRIIHREDAKSAKKKRKSVDPIGASCAITYHGNLIEDLSEPSRSSRLRGE